MSECQASCAIDGGMEKRDGPAPQRDQEREHGQLTRQELKPRIHEGGEATKRLAFPSPSTLRTDDVGCCVDVQVVVPRVLG